MCRRSRTTSTAADPQPVLHVGTGDVASYLQAGVVGFWVHRYLLLVWTLVDMASSSGSKRFVGDRARTFCRPCRASKSGASCRDVHVHVHVATLTVSAARDLVGENFV